MRTTITFLLRKLWGLAFVLFLVSPELATAGNFSTYTLTNNPQTNDLLLLDSTNTSGFSTHTIRVGDWLNGVNMKSNTTVWQENFNDTSNYYYISSGIYCTNGLGSLYLYVSNSAFFSLGLMDSLIVSNSVNFAQFIISAITNGNQTVAVLCATGVTGNFSNAGFFVYPATAKLLNSINQRCGGFNGAAEFGIANYSIGNNGGVSCGYYMIDGLSSASIINQQGSPNYLGISEGVGRGGSYGNQIIIQDGSVFNDLLIDSTNNIGIRGSLYNNQGTNFTWAAAQNVTNAIFQSQNFQATAAGTKVFSADISCTNGNAFAVLSTAAYNFTDIGDQLQIYNTLYYVEGKTNSNKTVALSMAVSGLASPFVSGPFTNNFSMATYYNPSAGRIAAYGPTQLHIAGPSLWDNGGVSLDDGINTAVISMQAGTPDYFSISVGSALGGSHGGQVVIQPGSLYNDLMILLNDYIGVRTGLTNTFGGPVAIRSGLNVPEGGATIAGAISNTAGNIVVATAGNGLTLTKGANARCGTNQFTAGVVVVANTSVTANTYIQPAYFVQPGALISGSAYGMSGIMISNTPGVGFTAWSGNGADTNQFKWIMTETQ
jgi:hypothetical protein